MISAMHDIITITELEVFYRIGVTKEERTQPQRLSLTVALHGDFASASRSDRLDDTIDYDALSRALRNLGQDREWNLIEALADDIATFILSTYPVTKVSVAVKKFVIPQARHVSFQLERQRD